MFRFAELDSMNGNKTQSVTPIEDITQAKRKNDWNEWLNKKHPGDKPIFCLFTFSGIIKLENLYLEQESFFWRWYRLAFAAAASTTHHPTLSPSESMSFTTKKKLI